MQTNTLPCAQFKPSREASELDIPELEPDDLDDYAAINDGEFFDLDN